MISYDWTCHKCGLTNRANTETCEKCGFSSVASSSENFESGGHSGQRMPLSCDNHLNEVQVAALLSRIALGNSIVWNRMGKFLFSLSVVLSPVVAWGTFIGESPQSDLAIRILFSAIIAGGFLIMAWNIHCFSSGRPVFLQTSPTIEIGTDPLITTVVFRWISFVVSLLFVAWSVQFTLQRLPLVSNIYG